MTSPTINMSLDPNDITVFPLKILWYGRFHPALNPCWTKFIVVLNLLICCLLIVLAIKGIIVSYESDVLFLAECLQTCILMTHAIGKFSFLHVYKNNMIKLMEAKAKFWKIDDFDDEICAEGSHIIKFVAKILRSYYFLASSACILFDLLPLTTGYLPTTCYVPEGWFNFLTVILWYLSWSFNFAVPGTDSLFCSLGTSLVVQFKLLAHKFKAFNTENANPEVHLWEELKKLVQYHDFLLDFCKELNVTFQPVFLVQFLVSIASASMSVFMFTQTGNWTNRIKFAFYFVFLMVQSAFYCVPMEFVAHNADQISDALYESKWYEISHIQIKKSLVLTLARTQKILVFSAYGLIIINLRTFVLICKTIFSFYTYLNSVKKIPDSQ